jgi:hypothetical protein
MSLFVFRSLPLDADSRTQRNMTFFDKKYSYSCTWEKDLSKGNDANTFKFPFTKSGNSISRAIKYFLFLLWVPYLVLTKTKKK